MRENLLPEDLDGSFDTLVEDMGRAGVAQTMATLFVTKQDDLFASVATGLKRHTGRILAQLHLPPNHPEWAAANVRAAGREPTVAGARAAPSLFKLHPVDATLDPVWDACEKARLPVQLVVDGSKFCEPSSLEVLARERPGLPLVLAVTRARHKAGLPRLAKYPSVCFQVPALLDAEVRTGDPAFLRWALAHLPADRIMFGSDRLGREASYFAKTAALAALPPAAREGVGRTCALRVYGKRLAAPSAA